MICKRFLQKGPKVVFDVRQKPPSQAEIDECLAWVSGKVAIAQKWLPLIFIGAFVVAIGFLVQSDSVKFSTFIGCVVGVILCYFWMGFKIIYLLGMFFGALFGSVLLLSPPPSSGIANMTVALIAFLGLGLAQILGQILLVGPKALVAGLQPIKKSCYPKLLNWTYKNPELKTYLDTIAGFKTPREIVQIEYKILEDSNREYLVEKEKEAKKFKDEDAFKRINSGKI